MEQYAEDYWNGKIDVDERMHQPLPFACEDLEEVTQNVFFQISFGNCSVIKTSQGLVLIDTGILDTGMLLYERIKKHFPNQWIIACIYTHGHIDHVEGLIAIQEQQYLMNGPKITVYGHKNISCRFDRYCKTCGYNEFINNRQFNSTRDVKKSFDKFIHPDIVYENTLEVVIGDIKFVLHHDRGETDDATWIHIPKYNVIFTGDLFIWCTPNCGNPQKVQRYPLEWSQALLKMANLNASLLIPGHGPFIRGKERINQALSDTGTFLNDIVTQTLELINKGIGLNDILYMVKPNAELLKKEYLKPYYDDPEFIVRNLWRQYAGWWNFDLLDLKPERKVKIAQEIAYIYRLKCNQIEHINYLYNKNELKSALYFIEMAYIVYPHDTEIIKLRIDILEKIKGNETSLMARNIYGHALDELKSKL